MTWAEVWEVNFAAEQVLAIKVKITKFQINFFKKVIVSAFILVFYILISVPNAFFSFNFQNLDLIKFARSFHAMLTSQPFLYFAQALVSRLVLNFRHF